MKNPTVKVAYVLTSIDFGGSDRVSLNFIKNVNRERFEIVPVLLTRPWEADNTFVQELEGARYPVLKVPVALRPRNEGPDRLRIIRCLRMMRSILTNDSFDLVHAHGYFADIVSIPVAKALSVPVVSTCHGFISNDLKLRAYNSLDRFILRFADKVIAVSDEIKQQLVRSGIEGRRIEVLLNAVHAHPRGEQASAHRAAKRKFLNVRDSEWIVGYIGRLSPEKGVKNLIRAGSMLVESGAPLKIVIIGDGPELPELTALVDQCGLASRVIFVGFQSDTSSWMPALDVLCLPSFTEGTPMSLLEAMAHGLPVVASAVGGIPSIIQSGHNGILVSPNQPEELSQALARLFEDDSLRKRVSEGALKTIEKDHNIDQWTRRIEDQYERLSRDQMSRRST
jgi:glycosyltransferase involved in cell wall biosynthesis